MNTVRTIFLSDLHIGHKNFDVGAVVDFLTQTDAKIIYLVGDIIDGWKMKKRWTWSASYTALLDVLIDKQKNGAKIIYITGNHDEDLRYLSPLRKALFSERLKIKLANMYVHKTVDKKRLIVMHGDQFDNFLLRGRVSRWGDAFYEMLGTVFGLYGRSPKIHTSHGLRPFSLAKTLVKRSGKTALKLLNNFERASSRLVKNKQADGIICGHTHMPKLVNLSDGRIFGNCGMWNGQKNTAIIENHDGMLELLELPQGQAVKHYSQMTIRHPKDTAMVIRIIRQIWHNDSLVPWLKFVDAIDQRINPSKSEADL